MTTKAEQWVKDIWHKSWQQLTNFQLQALAPTVHKAWERRRGLPTLCCGPHLRGREGAGHTYHRIFHLLTHSANIWPLQICRLTSLHQFWIIPSQLSHNMVLPPHSLQPLCLKLQMYNQTSHAIFTFSFSLLGIVFFFFFCLVSLCCILDNFF